MELRGRFRRRHRLTQTGNPAKCASQTAVWLANELPPAPATAASSPRRHGACTPLTLEWVDWYNHRRLLEPIGHVPPAEAEARYYDNPEDTALAA